MEIEYNKLVRDKIPEIIEANGNIPYTRKLDELQFERELNLKFYEELDELIEANDDKRVDELVDIFELVRAYSKYLGVDFKELVELADKKNELNGSFDSRLYLEKVINND